jgi:hypothetical protein
MQRGKNENKGWFLLLLFSHSLSHSSLFLQMVGQGTKTAFF